MVTIIAVVLMLAVTSASAGPTKLKLLATSVIVEPYLRDVTENDSYTGLVADVLSEMQALPDFKFSFQFTKVAGRRANGQLPEVAGKSWQHMIDVLVNGTVDLIAAPLAETQSREKKLDFTYPFHFSEAMLVVNSDLGVEDMTLEQLADSDHLNVGTVANGWMFAAMYNSGNKLLENMAKKMLMTHGALKRSNTEGLYAVRNNKNFVFITEGSAARSGVTVQPCKLLAIPTGMFKRRYSFAVANQSPLRDPLNNAIYKLSQRGVLETLDRHYFPSVCESSSTKSSIASLALVLVGVTMVTFLF